MVSQWNATIPNIKVATITTTVHDHTTIHTTNHTCAELEERGDTIIIRVEVVKLGRDHNKFVPYTRWRYLGIRGTFLYIDARIETDFHAYYNTNRTHYT